MKLWHSVSACIPMSLLSMALAATAVAQDFPTRPLRIVTGAPGGGNDVVSRLVAQGISPLLGQPVIVENQGGSNAILARSVMRAAPDGHTLLVSTASHWVVPMLEADAGYDAVRDFTPVAMLTQTPSVLVAHPSVGAKSVGELLALAKSKPGFLNFASGPAGSSPHLAAILFNSMAGLDITLVPYKGGGPALIDLIDGRVHLMFDTGRTMNPHIKSGKLRLLGVASAQPSQEFPGAPTVAASGVPGYESIVTQCMFAPAQTPATAVNRVNRAIAEFFGKPDVREKLLGMGTEPVRDPPSRLADHMKSEMARMSKVIREISGMRGG